MFRIGNVLGITKYLLLSALTLSSECLAAVNRVQNGDSDKELFSKSSASRSLLYSWDRDNDSRSDFRYNYNNDNSEKVIYIVVSLIIFLIAIICRCCFKNSCNDEDYSDTIVHQPPRNAGTLAPPPSGFGYSGTSSRSGPSGFGSSGTSTRSGSVLAPPRTSRSIILPLEAEAFPGHLYGFDNPNYHPENTISEQNYLPTIQNQTPLCDVLDMPPSYDAVVKEDIKYPKASGKK